jgi:serine protease Do
VVGVNSAITSPSGGNIGIGFAIPINLVHEVLDQLKDHGKVVRGWLGVQIGQLSKDLAEGLNLEGVEGVLINEVFADSPADKAGIKAGDVVLAIDGEKVSTAKDLQFIIAKRQVGSAVDLTINREGKTIHADVELGERPTEVAAASSTPTDSDWLGVRVVAADSPEVQNLGVDADEGVVVVNVRQGSPADRAGLRPGDIVSRVGRTLVSTPAEFRSLTDAAKEAGKPAVLLVKNSSGSRFVPIKPED